MRLAIIVGMLLLAGLGRCLAQPMSEPDALARAIKFADQVVRVIPERADGMPNQGDAGFGLIVGESAGKVYVATPYHVAFGNDRSLPSFNATPSIIFHQRPHTRISGRRMDRANPDDDLAVIEVALPPDLAPPRAPLVLASQLPRGTWVWNIGIGGRWDTPDRAGGLGIEEPLQRWRRVGNLRTPRGASGGAGVTANGVIGIVLQDARDYSLLLPVERIVQLFEAWGFPVNLLTRSPVSPIAAERWSDDVGGPGGTVFSPITCRPGEVLFGLYGNAGTGPIIFSLGPICATAEFDTGGQLTSMSPGWRKDDNVGSDQGSPFELICPPRMVVVGAELSSAVVGTNVGPFQYLVAPLNLRCSSVLRVESSSRKTVVGSGKRLPHASRKPFACPSGSAAFGIKGRAGEFIDAVSLGCRQP